MTEYGVNMTDQTDPIPTTPKRGRPPGKRPAELVRAHLNIRIGRALLARLDAAAPGLELTKTEIVERALDRYLAKRGH